jgi:hypothetical protein
MGTYVNSSPHDAVNETLIPTAVTTMRPATGNAVGTGVGVAAAVGDGLGETMVVAVAAALGVGVGVALVVLEGDEPADAQPASVIAPPRARIATPNLCMDMETAGRAVWLRALRASLQAIPVGHVARPIQPRGVGF